MGIGRLTEEVEAITAYRQQARVLAFEDSAAQRARLEQREAGVLTRVPVRRRESRETMEYFGEAFARHWEPFFSSHREEYESFVEQESLEDNVPLRMQWTAAMMVYELGRYGGALRVNFKNIDERDDIRTSESSAVGVGRQDIARSFRIILRDIVNGAGFTDPGSRQSYVSFGDCDEIALLMAQMMRSISDSNVLGLDPMIYRVEQDHASVAFQIGGRRYFLDPSIGSVESPRSLRSEFRRLRRRSIPSESRRAITDSLRRMREGYRPLPLYMDRYERGPAWKLEAALEGDPTLWPGWEDLPETEREAIRGEIGIPSMPPGQQDFVERAMEEVSSPPLPGQIALEREIRRRAWGYPPDPRIYGIIRQRFLPSAETPERRRLAIGLLTELVAASTQGSIGENLDLVSDSLEGKTEAQQIRTMRRLLRTAERRGRRLTRRDLERTI